MKRKRFAHKKGGACTESTPGEGDVLCNKKKPTIKKCGPPKSQKKSPSE